MEHRQFVMNIEQSIRLANRETLNQMILPMTKEKVISVAVEVAQARGTYLKSALDMPGQGESDQYTLDLKKLRQTYEEKRDAFANLMTAFERDYVDLPTPGLGSGPAGNLDDQAT